jgi:Ca-activated chloride channel family protein
MRALPSIAAVGLLCLAQIEAQDRTIRVDVDLVLVNVTVTDGRNRFVQDLTKEHFRIWEDKVEQEILSFSGEQAPVSMGIVLDRSGSMGSKRPKAGELISQSRSWIAECMTENLISDEYFLIEFSDRPEVLVDFTNDISRLNEKLVFLSAGGRTALWDAVYLGVNKVKSGVNPRKALLVLTDGMENRSRYRLSDLKNAVKETDVRIYGMDRVEVEFYGLDDLADITGGRVFRSSSPCKELAADLRNQYVIGYRPTNRAADGTWRTIQVKLNTQKLPGMSGLSVRARKGYTANEGASR